MPASVSLVTHTSTAPATTLSAQCRVPLQSLPTRLRWQLRRALSSVPVNSNISLTYTHSNSANHYVGGNSAGSSIC